MAFFLTVKINCAKKKKNGSCIWAEMKGDLERAEGQGRAVWHLLRGEVGAAAFHLTQKGRAASGGAARERGEDAAVKKAVIWKLPEGGGEVGGDNSPFSRLYANTAFCPHSLFSVKIREHGSPSSSISKHVSLT